MARSVRNAGRLDTALVVACLAISLFARVMPAKMRGTVSAALRGTVLAPFVTLESRSAGVRAAIASRNDLLQVRGRVATQALTAQSVADENATLRRLLGLSSRLRDGFVAAEIIPSRGVEDDFTLTLNVGSAAGVLPFSPVVMADGLVGMVESVDANTSFAITWAHPDFRVSAMSVNESAVGIVQPHLGTGAERWLLELRGVPFRAKLDTGTLVVSSGLGGTYPRGIPVGTVMGEIATPEKWARTYLVKPSVLPAAIGPVLVLLPQRAVRGVNGVWANMTSADSAARAIAAAGDSLARKAALDELSARRAALDSANAVNGITDSTALIGAPPIAPPTAGGPVIPQTHADSVRADSARRARAGRVDSVRKPTVVPPARAVPPSGGSAGGSGAPVRPPAGDAR